VLPGALCAPFNKKLYIPRLPFTAALVIEYGLTFKMLGASPSGRTVFGGLVGVKAIGAPISPPLPIACYSPIVKPV